ncbi:unnamed protein product (macronuclear) [Paramecium tetraurelia]|uniref:UBA domain-containing protein n=1 Tax=Paramecium tetraurelia TaxID=5888 RepID=A0E1X3_PARTE|nr:uncharacterized protein GSPATT00022461001 [Paramecium tetraurelia]CAK89290.1 unnamed protein product [Paramecium tetraurelia]|eukprot:XP_001456687.1 hypothetical protein (macronuclear) [Paramecium tetraurelia strain d4-2]
MLQQFLNMGFTQQQILKAQQICKQYRNLEILDVLLKNVQSPIKDQSQQQSQSQILRELSFDVLTPDQRLRQKGIPVGLKNLANGFSDIYVSLLFEFSGLDIFSQPNLCEGDIELQIPCAIEFRGSLKQE